MDSNVVEELPPKTAQKCLAAIERALDTREVQETEYSISVLAGELDFSARISPLGEDRVVFVARDITELKERERELEEVKNRLELAVEGGNLGIWDWDMTTDSVQYNDQWARMLGYSRAEIEPHLEAWKERVHPDDLEEVREALNDHIAGETKFYKKEQRLKTADGDWKWLLDVGKIFEWDEDGEPVRSVGIHIDIDERKRLERTLKEERDMFSRGPTVVFKWENVQSGRIKYVSDNVEDVLGYTPEQLLSGEITYNDIVHEEDHARVREEVITGRESEVEGFTHDPYRVVTADGEVRWVLDHTKNLWQDEEGAQLLGYVIDITRRKQMAEELRKNKERLDALLSNTPSVIYTYEVVDGAPETTYVSESVRNVLGHDPEYYVSDPENFMNDLHPEDAEELFEKEEKLLTDEDTEKITAEYRFKDNEGDYHWLRDEQKLLVQDGDRQRVIGSWWDITALKEQEKELKRSNEELEQFADKAAHDLKQPLSVISHSAELLELKNQDVLKEDSEEYVETIVQKADLVSNLLDKLVDYARLDSQIEDFVPVDLEKIITSCCENLEEHINETQTEVICEDLPPVEGDHPQLVRVFQNLIDNAIKYRSEEPPEIKISAESEQGQGVEISVSDNGSGIAPGEQDKIFDIFYRIKSSEEIAGTGIGLANCQKIIEQHGGKIEVESELGKGTNFILTLPAAEGEN
ncbi:MAG: PAS domain-containing protein [bacterium]